MGLSKELSCEAGSFSLCLLNPHRFFSVRGFEALFPCVGTLGCAVCLIPSCSSWFICTRMWGRLVCQLLPIHPVLQPPPFRQCSLPGCPSLPLLPVWMNVSSLSPWLLDFHTVRFSVSSGCFLFLNCCCPSFGCARRHSVSTYASILAGSPILFFRFHI